MNTDLSGFEESVGFTRIVMTIIGVWPGLNKNLRFYFILPTFWMLFFNFIPQTTLVIVARNNYNLVLDVMCTAQVIVGLGIFKLLVLRYNQQDLRKLVENVLHDWKSSTEAEQRIMWRNAKKSRFIAIFSLLTIVGSVVTLTVRNVFGYVINKKYLLPNETLAKPVFLQSKFFFNTDDSPVHELIFIGQFIAGNIASCCFSSLDGFFAFTILHLSGELHNLQKYLENLVVEKNRKNGTMEEMLIPIIEKHRRVYRCIHIIERNFNVIFLFQMLATSLILLLQGYQAVFFVGETTVDLITHVCFYAVYLISSLVSLFIYCYIVEHLRTESEGLFYAVYRMQWYKLHPNESKLLLMFMARTITPIEVSVGKIGKFSLVYFCSILRSLAGYLSMLLAMKDRINDY